MPSAFFYGLLGSAIIAVVYGLLFAQREDKIRSYLSRKRRGWIRWRYVRAFVGAVRGKAVATDTAILAFFALLVPFIIGGSLLMIADDAEYEIRQAWTRLQEIQDTDQMRRDIDKEVARLEDELTELTKRAHRNILRARIAGWALITAVYFGLLFWYPFVVMRRRFDHELQRFTLRIQGLGSKSELAELAVAESKVKNEETLRHFFEVTRKIAERHNIPELVSTFDLWGEQETA